MPGADSVAPHRATDRRSGRTGTGAVLARYPLAARSRSARIRGAIFSPAPDVPVLHFPDWETLPYDSFSPHQDIVSERLRVLTRLPELSRGIVVVAAQTLLQRLPPVDYVRSARYGWRAARRWNARPSYKARSGRVPRVPQVSEHGEFAVRGSIVDLFPMGAAVPLRIDFFDDEIETLRSSTRTRSCSTPRCRRLKYYPPARFRSTSAIRDLSAKLPRALCRAGIAFAVYRDVSDGIAHGGIEYYLPLFFPTTATLLDYLPAATRSARRRAGRTRSHSWFGNRGTPRRCCAR